MAKVHEVFTTSEAARILHISGMQIKRILIGEIGDMIGIEKDDYRQTDEGAYLITDTAIEKIKSYRERKLR